ncbi:MAG: hypothetical protein ACKOQ2_06315, partial [Dolichospermum sp.]
CYTQITFVVRAGVCQNISSHIFLEHKSLQKCGSKVSFPSAESFKNPIGKLDKLPKPDVASVGFWYFWGGVT